MKKLTFTICLSLFISVLFAQNPTLYWAKGFGGSTNDKATGIAKDASGNVYTTGYFTGTVDFDPGAGVSNITSIGGFDIFITKFDAVGNFVWVKRMGGALNDVASAITLDASGNIYTTGYFSDIADFDPSAGANFDITSSGGKDIFISKLDASGNFVWAKQITATTAVDGFGVSLALDGLGNLIVAGEFQGFEDFDPGAGSFGLSSAGNNDIFILKLTTAGVFVWAEKFGSSSSTSDDGNKVVTDASGNIYCTGQFSGTVDFDASVGGTQNLVSAGGADIYILKLDASGNYVWAKRVGGAIGTDVGYSIAVDAAGNSVITGNYTATVDFDPNIVTNFNLTAASSSEGFILKLDASGNFVWAKRNAGTVANDISAAPSNVIDASGNIYAVGFFKGTIDFDPSTTSAFNLSTGNISNADMYIQMLTASGNFVYAKQIGGTNFGRFNEASSVVIDGISNLYIAGDYSGTVDFDPNAGVYSLT